MHEERLPECKEIQCEMKHQITRHIDESIPVRENVAKHNEQIITLNKAHEATMQDIKDIKQALVRLERMILTAAIAGLLVLCGEAIYFGGYLRQVDINTNRIGVVEEQHRNGIK